MSDIEFSKKDAAINADLIKKSMPSIGILSQKKRIGAYKFATDYAMKLTNDDKVASLMTLVSLVLMSNNFSKALDNIVHDIYKWKIINKRDFNYVGRRLALNYAIQKGWVANPAAEWQQLGPVEGESFD